MADVSDVSNTLVGLVSGYLYPTGTSNPCAVAGVAGIRVYAGWPVPDQLDLDLANQVNQQPSPICHVSVWPSRTEKNTTRYLETWMPALVNTATLAIVATGNTVAISGTVPPSGNPHNVVIFANGIPYVYAVQVGDTLNAIAAALAALINAHISGTTSSGASVLLPASARVGPCRIGVQVTSVKEICRQERQWQVSVWSHAPDARDAIAKIIDPALKALTFISLPDYTSGRIRAVGSPYFDIAEKMGIYRRDLNFTVEYATTLTEVDTQITQVQLNTRVGPDPNATPITVYE